MAKTRGQVIRRQAISELERLSHSLDEAFEITAKMTITEIEEELREMGIDPSQLPALSLGQIISGKDESRNPAYVFVSNELLGDEPAALAAKGLIIELRYLSRQQRYEEALELARQATQLAPRYWRAWLSYGGLLTRLGKMAEGEAIYRRLLEDFSDHPKAVAAALHNCGGALEIRCDLNPSGETLQKVLHYYEDALKVDVSRANTRACLSINLVSANQLDKSNKLIEDSRLCEGFFDEMSFELKEREARGVKTYKIIQALPMWLRNLLHGAGPGSAGIMRTVESYG